MRELSQSRTALTHGGILGRRMDRGTAHSSSVVDLVGGETPLTRRSGQSGQEQEKDSGSNVTFPKRQLLEEHRLSSMEKTWSWKSPTALSIFVGAADESATSHVAMTSKETVTILYRL